MQRCIGRIDGFRHEAHVKKRQEVAAHPSLASPTAFVVETPIASLTFGGCGMKAEWMVHHMRFEWRNPLEHLRTILLMPEFGRAIYNKPDNLSVFLHDSDQYVKKLGLRAYIRVIGREYMFFLKERFKTLRLYLLDSR